MITKCRKVQSNLEEFLSALSAGSLILILTFITFSCDEPLFAQEGDTQTISVICFRDGCE